MWYNRFKEGQGNVNNDARRGLPSTSSADENFEVVKKIILDNPRIAIKEVAHDVSGLSFSSCQAIFTDVLGIKRGQAKIVALQGYRSGIVDCDSDLLKRS